MAPTRDSRLGRIALILFFVALIGYAIYEGWGMLYGPSIEIPAETVTVHEAYTLISGHAERITELRLNGKPIPVTENGEFQEPFLLAPGSNYLILEASDARGRMTKETLIIQYVPTESSVPTPTSTSTTD